MIFTRMIRSETRLTSNTFSIHFSATNTPTPAVPLLFPDQNSLYLESLPVIIQQWPPRYLVSWTQQRSTFLRDSVSTTSQTLPFRVFTLRVPTLKFLRCLHHNKGTTILYWFRPPETLMNPPVNGKSHGLFKAFECFSSTFQSKFNFQNFSRQSWIFKYFSSQCEPWLIKEKHTLELPDCGFVLGPGTGRSECWSGILHKHMVTAAS